MVCVCVCVVCVCVVCVSCVCGVCVRVFVCLLQRYLACSMFLRSDPRQVEPEGSAQTLWPGRLLWVARPLGQATGDGAETL